jgi:DNA-binding NtrC family response regulator
VIDDEEDILRLTKDLLAPVGYNVLTAKDGREGINIFKERKDEIRVILLDMIMPGMSGREVFQKLKEIDQKVKVILCSGYSEEGFNEIKQLLKTGIIDFVQKPFSRTTLALALKKAITSPKH